MMKELANRAMAAASVALLLIGGGAATAQAQEDRAGLEEVVVTAQKREQSLLDVPVSVNAFSGETLRLNRTNDFQDIVQVSPSITYTQSQGMRGSGVLIRGIGTANFQTAVELKPASWWMASP